MKEQSSNGTVVLKVPGFRLALAWQIVEYAPGKISVSGLPGTSTRLFLYYEDADFQGGQRELRAVEDPVPLLQRRDTVFVTSWQFTYPPAGSVMTLHLPTPPQAEPEPAAPPVDIDRMVSRFLAWRLPDSFNPDGGITFNKEPDARGYVRTWPTGTNLLDADQARAMLEHVLGLDNGGTRA